MRLAILIATLVWSSLLNAQSLNTFGPNSILASPPVSPAEDDSGRYVVKPKSNKNKDVKSIAEKVEVQTHKANAQEGSTGSDNLTQDVDQSLKIKPSKPSFIEKARDSVLGGNPETVDEYRTVMSFDDPRRNVIEFSISPFLLHNSSNSNYWLRNYSSLSSGIGVDADVWLGPMFGLHGGYKRSLDATIKNQHNTDSEVAVTHEMFELGFRFRRSFGLKLTSPDLMFGVDYRDYQFKVPGDESNRVKFNTRGPKFLLEARLPTSQGKHAHILGTEILPIIKHTEQEAGAPAYSGEGNESYGYGVWYGNQFILDRDSRIFIKLHYYLEKNIFNGSAYSADPNSGLTPNQVTVTNHFLFFQLGYTWGK